MGNFWALLDLNAYELIYCESNLISIDFKGRKRQILIFTKHKASHKSIMLAVITIKYLECSSKLICQKLAILQVFSCNFSWFLICTLRHYDHDLWHYHYTEIQQKPTKLYQNSFVQKFRKFLKFSTEKIAVNRKLKMTRQIAYFLFLISLSKGINENFKWMN